MTRKIKTKPPLIDVDLETEIIRSVANHEVFLIFNNDDDAEAFVDWWELKGLELFSKWVSDGD